MPTIAVYDWSVVSHDGALTTDQLVSDDHANDPAAAGYDPGRASWTGITYTYSGATPTQRTHRRARDIERCHTSWR